MCYLFAGTVLVNYVNMILSYFDIIIICYNQNKSLIQNDDSCSLEERYVDYKEATWKIVINFKSIKKKPMKIYIQFVHFRF